MSTVSSAFTCFAIRLSTSSTFESWFGCAQVALSVPLRLPAGPGPRGPRRTAPAGRRPPAARARASGRARRALRRRADGGRRRRRGPRGAAASPRGRGPRPRARRRPPGPGRGSPSKVTGGGKRHQGMEHQTRSALGRRWAACRQPIPQRRSHHSVA